MCGVRCASCRPDPSAVAGCHLGRQLSVYAHRRARTGQHADGVLPRQPRHARPAGDSVADARALGFQRQTQTLPDPRGNQRRPALSHVLHGRTGTARGLLRDSECHHPHDGGAHRSAVLCRSHDPEQSRRRGHRPVWRGSADPYRPGGIRPAPALGRCRLPGGHRLLWFCRFSHPMLDWNARRPG